MAVKIVGAQAWSGITLKIQRQDGVSPQRTVNLTDGDWYLLGDGTASDGLTELQDQVRAAGAEMTPFTVTIDSEGIVTLTMDHNTTLTWFGGGASAAELRDQLRFPGPTTTLINTSATADRPVLGSFYPVRTVIEDLPDDEVDLSQTRPRSGNPETFGLGSRRADIIVLQAEGFPRDDAYNEFHALESLVKDWCGAGKRLRYYRDASNTSPYADVTNPGGYVVRVADADYVRRWRPLAQVAGWYRYWQQELRLLAHSGA